MPSTAIDSQIHGCMFSTDEMRETLSDRAWAQKWLDTEAALAKAQAELGIIPQERPISSMNTPRPNSLTSLRSASSTSPPLRSFPF